MAKVFCDPNYKPSELYLQIEGLLLFYDQILLYAPSQRQIQAAGLDPRRLMRLIQAGLVVPVGRRFWFDSGERDALTARFATNPEKSSTYRWSELDEAILSVGPYRAATSSTGLARGYLVASDDHREYADEMERVVPRTRTSEFLKLVEQAARLRNNRRLPNELLHGPLADATPERLAAHLVYSAAGDVRLCENLAVATVFSTPEMGEVYRAISRSFIPMGRQSRGQLTVLNPFKEYLLTEEELRIAGRLAQQIVGSDEIGPLDLDLLLEYRQTACSLLFREFVAHRLAILADKSGTLSDAELRAVFEADLNQIDLIDDWAPFLSGVSVATLGQFLLDERLHEKSLGRRSVLTLMAGLAFSLFSDRVLPEVVTEASTKVVSARYARLFALVKKQRDRKRARSGKS